MTTEQLLLAEALAEIDPDTILRRPNFRAFCQWFPNWKARAEAAISAANAGTFHAERIVVEDDSETDIGCSPCEEAARREEEARRNAGHADA